MDRGDQFAAGPVVTPPQHLIQRYPLVTGGKLQLGIESQEDGQQRRATIAGHDRPSHGCHVANIPAGFEPGSSRQVFREVGGIFDQPLKGGGPPEYHAHICGFDPVEPQILKINQAHDPAQAGREPRAASQWHALC